MNHFVVLTEKDMAALLRGVTIIAKTTKGEKVTVTNEESYERFYRRDEED